MQASTLKLLLALKTNPSPTPDWILKTFNIQLETLTAWMQALNDLNISIDHYQWQSTFEPIDLNTLQHMLHWENLAIEYKMSTPSTHLYQKALKKHSDNPSLCIAEHQSKGIGQRQKTWASPFGNNLYFSLNLCTTCHPQALSGLSLMVGLSILKALRLPALKIKWPNDIYLADQKLAGILIDLGPYQHSSMCLTISIGLNVNQTEHFALDIPWTSLQKITGKPQHRTLILAQILNQIQLDMAIFETHGFHAFLQEWQTYDALFQQEVIVTQADNRICGKALGVDDMGRMLLEVNHTILALNFGEASIKPRAFSTNI